MANLADKKSSIGCYLHTRNIDIGKVNLGRASHTSTKHRLILCHIASKHMAVDATK